MFSIFRLLCPHNSAYANWTLKEKASSKKMCAVRNDTVAEVHSWSKNKAKKPVSVINDPHLHLYTCTWFFLPFS